jgi:hypothetical protein
MQTPARSRPRSTRQSRRKRFTASDVAAWLLFFAALAVIEIAFCAILWIVVP